MAPLTQPRSEHDCKPCNWIFFSASELQMHIIKDHAIVICITCDMKKFQGTDAFKAHYPFNLHRFKCGKCDAALNGSDNRTLTKAIGHLKACQSILDRHCLKVYTDQEPYYEHCRTDKFHIAMATAWERDDYLKRCKEREERKAEIKKRQIQQEESWKAFQLEKARERLEYERMQAYPAFEPEKYAREAIGAEKDVKAPESQMELKFLQVGGFQVEFSSGSSSSGSDYDTDWTDHATMAEEAQMSIKERMKRKHRREKRAAKLEAKRKEEERNRLEQKRLQEEAIQAAILEARMKLTKEELEALEEKEREKAKRRKENEERLRAWILAKKAEREKFKHMQWLGYKRDD